MLSLEKMTIDWILCTGSQEAKTSLDSDRIVAALSETIDCFFDLKRPKDGARTRLVKKRLSILGHQLKYRVYANGLSVMDLAEIGNGMRNVEWLYDLHWYTDQESEPYCQNSMKLVMECEWGNNRKERKSPPENPSEEEKAWWAKMIYTEVKYDFQKLLVTNANLRLLVFRLREKHLGKDLEELSGYFHRAINGYETLEKGAPFLFVAFLESQRCFFYQEIKRA